MRLTKNHIPSWVNRAARVGHAIGIQDSQMNAIPRRRRSTPDGEWSMTGILASSARFDGR